MSKSTQLKAALVVVLAGLALVSPCGALVNPCGLPRAALLVAAFGIFNVLATASGTLPVRVAGVAMAFVGLLVPRSGMLGFLLLLAWALWLPAFLASWAVARRRDLATNQTTPADASGRTSRLTTAAIIAAVALAALAFRLFVFNGIQQTAALFVGIPALIAIVVVVAISPRSATGVACKAVTVALLVSLLFLQEGFLCVAMSAPLFYVVAIGIGASVDFARRRRNRLSALGAVLLVTLPASFEGVTPATTIPRDESIAVTRVVHASSQEVERALFAPPRFDRTRPRYLRAGFPSVTATRIEHDAAGTRWVMTVRGGEMRLNGMEPRTGELALALDEQRPGLLRWRAVSDSSHTTHFLRWRESLVEWEPIDATTTNVTWTLRYERGLDPAWYFGPMERYAVRLAAGYLIEAVATP